MQNSNNDDKVRIISEMIWKIIIILNLMSLIVRQRVGMHDESTTQSILSKDIKKKSKSYFKLKKPQLVNDNQLNNFYV